MTVDKLRTELEPLVAKLRRTSPASSAIFAAACVNPDGPEAADAITALLLRIEGLTEALGDTLAVAKLKWGNLDEDVNGVFRRAEQALSQ